MNNTFTLDRESILSHPRVSFIQDVLPIDTYLDQIEEFINKCYVEEGVEVFQHGRVIALRHTDVKRKSSAFKSAIYLGKYNNMDNDERFLKKMVTAGHSYEPIRGESILFLFIGVGKPNYDHLITYGTGRTTRIAGGQRANLPWGYEIPAEIKHDSSEKFMKLGLEKVSEVVQITKGMNEDVHRQQIQAARSLLPVGYVMPPFLLEFSEEALIKSVFTQRLFERGAQGATVDIVDDMWQCVLKIDEKKWSHLYEYHGTHIEGWKRAMRTIRDKDLTMADLIDLAQKTGAIDLNVEYNLNDINLYDVLMKTVGKLPPSMWDKQK